jgi:hypothetical protein
VQPAAADLLAVDHTVLRNGVHPPRVLVNGRAASAERRPHGGNRVIVEPGGNRLKPVTRMVRQLPAGRQPDQMVIPRVWLLAGFAPGRPGG